MDPPVGGVLSGGSLPVSAAAGGEGDDGDDGDDARRDDDEATGASVAPEIP
jgi:hypothetical protein